MRYLGFYLSGGHIPVAVGMHRIVVVVGSNPSGADRRQVAEGSPSAVGRKRAAVGSPLAVVGNPLVVTGIP